MMFFNNNSINKFVATVKSTRTNKLPTKSKAHELLLVLFYQMKRMKRRSQPIAKIHIKLGNKANQHKIQLKL